VRAALAVNRLLGRFGLQLTRARPRRDSLPAVLRHLRDRGLRPATVIDGGAAFGEWTATCRAVWPEARYLAVEPLAELQRFLDGVELVPAALGRASGTTTFYVHADLSASSTFEEHEEDLEQKPREVACVTVDELVSERDASGPFLVKLDLQGAELEALSGAVETLRATEAVVLEATLLPVFLGGPELGDVVAFLRERGFVPYEIFDLRYRPLDGALVQADLVFVPETSPFRRERGYATAEQRRRLDADAVTRYRGRLER
jgi:FkbM family methyltransferase